MTTTSSNLPPIPTGWVGGFSTSNSAFAYPHPDLSSLPMMGNMQHMPLLKRQQGVRWPEFSWLADPTASAGERCFQMFSPFISRLGYTNTGRVYSIICPQQGVWLRDEMCLNIEVSVTGVRGWVNESADPQERTLAADMTVQARVWLTPGQHQGNLLKRAWPYLQAHFPEVPLSKKHAILINTSNPDPPYDPIFHLREGETDQFTSPDFARHCEDRGFYTVGHLAVRIGNIEKKNNAEVDDFNQLLMNGFNVGSGNMLAHDSVLTWNVWFTEPQLVNCYEWESHAAKWRESIDAHHAHLPYSKEVQQEWPDLFADRPVRLSNGATFKPDDNAIGDALHDVYEWIEQHI